MRRLGLPLFRPPDGLVTENLRQLGRRVLAFYGPEALAEQSRGQFMSSTVREKWNTPAESKPDWTTFESAFVDIEKLLEEDKINHAQKTDLVAFYNGKRAQLD